MDLDNYKIITSTEIDNKIPIKIYKKFSEDGEEYERPERNPPVLELSVEDFISYEDGDSSMLICIDLVELDYMYIDESVCRFKAFNMIEEYNVESKRTGMKCPYAKDLDKYYYLFRANVVTKIPNRWRRDPYDYFYGNNILSSTKKKYDVRVYKDGAKYNYKNIGYVYTDKGYGKQNVELTWDSSPEEGYDRKEKFAREHNGMLKLYRYRKEGTRKVKEFIERDEYVRIMKEFGEERGYLHLEFTDVL